MSALPSVIATPAITVTSCGRLPAHRQVFRGGRAGGARVRLGEADRLLTNSEDPRATDHIFGQPSR